MMDVEPSYSSKVLTQFNHLKLTSSKVAHGIWWRVNKVHTTTRNATLQTWFFLTVEIVVSMNIHSYCAQMYCTSVDANADFASSWCMAIA